MLLIREAGPADFPGVFALARILDSYNLPADRTLIRRLLEDSRDSFRGRLPRAKARYLFVLENRELSPKGTVPKIQKIVGCSLIMAKHGTPGHPHFWLALDRVTKRSRTLGICRTHEVLRLGWTEDGPTEVGGLVVLPAWRRRWERCGLQISYARFLYMAMRPGRFEREVLIEYRGAMGRGSRSLFWESVGRVFTGLEYTRADRLSVTHKEFILSLLPREPIYCALLPKSVQRAIGAIHPSAEPAARLARRQGFRRMRQVEPFDGGPYYLARRRRIQVVRSVRRLRIFCQSGTPHDDDQFYLVGTEAGRRFRAVLARGRLFEDRFLIGKEGFDGLGVKEGEWGYASRLSR